MSRLLQSGIQRWTHVRAYSVFDTQFPHAFPMMHTSSDCTRDILDTAFQQSIN
jgi:hypothetical protein